MKRILLVAAGIALAGGIAATPAVAGLAGNPSFSHEIPVPKPSQAQQPVFLDDHGGRTTSPATRHPEPGDDHGHAATTPAAPGAVSTDDHGGLTPHAEPFDDHGGLTPHAEPFDDHHRGGGTSSGGSGGGNSGRG
jgi:hypothetical protein